MSEDSPNPTDTPGTPAPQSSSPGNGDLTAHDPGVKPVAEPQPVTQTPTTAPNSDAGHSYFGGGQIFMMVLTLAGILLVAQGLRRKPKKVGQSEFAEIDAIRRELAAKYPIEPKPKHAPATANNAAAAAMQELADRLAGELDAKAARLESLLAEADRKLTELRAAGGDSPSIPVARIGPAEVPRLSKSAAGVEPMHQRVYDLADAGMSSVEIAKAVQQPTGHVELILNLRAAAQGTGRRVGM